MGNHGPLLVGIRRFYVLAPLNHIIAIRVLAIGNIHIQVPLGIQIANYIITVVPQRLDDKLLIIPAVVLLNHQVCALCR